MLTIKNKSLLEVTTGQRQYQFHCDPDSPLGEIYDALFKMMSYVMQRMDDQNQKNFEIRPNGSITPPKNEDENKS